MLSAKKKQSGEGGKAEREGGRQGEKKIQNVTFAEDHAIEKIKIASSKFWHKDVFIR